MEIINMGKRELNIRINKLTKIVAYAEELGLTDIMWEAMTELAAARQARDKLGW